MKITIVNGFTAKIGQNAKENWFLLENAKPEYYFFHLRSFSSCYVIWEYEGDDVKEDTLQELAKICLANTKHRDAKNIKVDCTRCKNLEKGNIVGEVVYKSRRKVQVIKI